VPLAPFVLLYALAGIRALGAGAAARLGTSHARARRLGHGLALAAALALLAHHARGLPDHLDPRLRPDGSPTAQAASWANLDAVASWLRAHTEPDHVVLCNQAPILRLLSGRQAYTYRFGRPRVLLERYRPHVVVFDAAAPPALRRQVEARARERADLPDRLTGRRIPIFVLGPDDAGRNAGLR
jgi:hypothetical protein